MRSIEERLEEYAKATRGIVPQLELVRALAPAEMRLRLVSSHDSLNDAIRLYGLFADDLDKILRGEELEQFRIEGTIPGAGA